MVSCVSIAYAIYRVEVRLLDAINGVRMHKMKTLVTYSVPDLHYCNQTVRAKPTKVCCRFCIKVKPGAFSCALYNLPLLSSEGFVVYKCKACNRASAIKQREPNEVK